MASIPGAMTSASSLCRRVIDLWSGSRADSTHWGICGLISERPSRTSQYYHGDQLGSTRGITSAAQAVTDPESLRGRQPGV